MFTVSNQQQPPEVSRATLRIWVRRVLILLTILGVLTLMAVAVWIAGHIITTLLIVIVGALIAYAIVPVVDVFHRVMPRALAITLSYLCVIIILGVILYLVVGTAIFQISLMARSITIWLKPDSKGNTLLLELLLRAGLTSAQITALQQQLTAGLSDLAGSLASGLVPLLGGLIGGLLNILLTVVISIYLLIDGGRAVRWMRLALPRPYLSQVGSIIDTMQRVVGGYIRGQILLCTVNAFLVGIGLSLIRFPYAILIGVLTFITEFIPVLGTIICGAIAVLLALTQGWVMTVEVLGFFILIHIIEGYVLAPRLVGKAVELNPAIMLVALTLGGELFGPFGAIFAAPVAGLLQAFCIALWLQYRQTHAEEFMNHGDISQGKSPAGIATGQVSLVAEDQVASPPLTSPGEDQT